MNELIELKIIKTFYKSKIKKKIRNNCGLNCAARENGS